MSYNLIWIFLLILQTFVKSLPIQDRYDLNIAGIDHSSSPDLPKYGDTLDSGNEQVISVRITSSVAVGRGKEQSPYIPPNYKYEPHGEKHSPNYPTSGADPKILSPAHEATTLEVTSDFPPNLLGANIEYIKQLHAKKEHLDPMHSFQSVPQGQLPNENESTQGKLPMNIAEYDEDIKNIPTARKIPSASDANQFHEQKENRGYHPPDMNVQMSYHNRNGPLNLTTEALSESTMNFGTRINMDSKINVDPEAHTQTDKKGMTDINIFESNSKNYQTDDSIAEPSIKSVEFAKSTVTVPPSSSYIPNIPNRPFSKEQNNPRLTTVSFDIVHDATKTNTKQESRKSYVTTSQIIPNRQQFYEPPKIYSEPAKIYSEPAKFYSEPAKIYSEPAKIYSEPAKVYSEPAKIYSEPAKFYSEPASLHLDQNVPNVPPSIPPSYSPWPRQPHRAISSTTINTTPITTITNIYQTGSTQMEHQPEKNYEVDEKISVLTDGRSHGVQESSTEKCKQDNCKVGYVVEGRQYKKYRVEERTSDGFIVGEYGVVRNEDGALRGVRYTADSDASPRLIHDALMKFLQLK